MISPVMEWLRNPGTLFYLLVFLIWIYRGIRALETLRLTPAISNKNTPALQNPPLVSIIVPAKNEEKNIAFCLKSLLAQDYPSFEILAANDNSSDRTPQMIKNLGAQKLLPGESSQHETGGNAAPLFYFDVSPTPGGWTGKNFALHSAVRFAKGEWFLFTDADTRHEPMALFQVMGHALSRRLDFLTLLPRCITATWLEHFIQPCAMSFIGLWFPMEKVNDPHSQAYFANGQFLLIRRSVYEALGGHAGVREEFLEDFALAKKAKRQGARTECALGVNLYGTRMYDSPKAMWRGWRRIFLHAFEKNPWRLAGKMMSVFIFSVLPFMGILLAGTGGILPWAVLLFIFITCLAAYDIVKARKVSALLHPLAALFVMGVLFDAMRVALTKGKTNWR